MQVLCSAEVYAIENFEQIHLTMGFELRHSALQSELKQKCKAEGADWGIMPVAQVSI